MATLAEMVATVRARLDEALGEHQWLDTELKGWINEGVRDVARRTESLQVYDTIAGIAGTHKYTLPTDIVRATILEWVPDAGQVFPMQYVPMHAFKQSVPATQEDTQGRPILWTIWGFGPSMELFVYPTPGEAGDFRLYYYRMPADLATDGSDDSDTLTIPSGWEDVVADYVEYRAKRKDGNQDWTAAKELYDEHLMDLNETAIQWSDQAGTVVTPSGPIPAWLVNDGGW